MKLATLILFILCLAPIANARLGDSPFWCITQYGSQGDAKPRDDVKRLWFKKDGYRICCEFTEGKCTQITYFNSKKWDDSAVESLLYANKEGGSWTPQKTAKQSGLLGFWMRDDNGAAALRADSFVLRSPDHF